MVEPPNSRRTFLKQSFSLAFSFAGLNLFAKNIANNSNQANNITENAQTLLETATTLWQKSLCEGYGTLQRDKNELLNLPKGFYYKIIMQSGTKLSEKVYATGGVMDVLATDNGKFISCSGGSNFTKIDTAGNIEWQNWFKNEMILKQGGGEFIFTKEK